MSKSGRQYADDVRELRAQGVDFLSASEGYLLADAANWSSGQKAAVTRAINQFDFSEFDAQEAARAAKPVVAPRDVEVQDLPDAPFEADMSFFDDGAGDAEEEYDDIDFFDFDESVEFQEDEADLYPEV